VGWLDAARGLYRFLVPGICRGCDFRVGIPATGHDRTELCARGL